MEGWNEDKIQDAIDLMDGDIRDALYEMQNCIRGCNTGCTTYEELGKYLAELGERLKAEGEAIATFEEDPEDELEEDEEEE